MIISHKHRFVFVKTFKTAGTSLEVFLSRHCGDQDVVTPIYPPVPGHQPRNADEFFNHMPARDIRRRLSDQGWQEYFKFCVERNPWDKVLSYYWMERHRSGIDLTLDDFLTRDHIGESWHLYSDEVGQPLVDRFVYYESLETDLREVLGNLGIHFDGDLGVRAKGEYRLDRRPYREVLTEGQATVIAHRFSKEIAWHGYQY